MRVLIALLVIWLAVHSFLFIRFAIIKRKKKHRFKIIQGG